MPAKPFAELTPAEIRLLALLKLGISTKQMAYMLGVNMNTIRIAATGYGVSWSSRRGVQAGELIQQLVDPAG